MGDSASRKPQTGAAKLRQLSELQTSNLKAILAEADAQREFTAECVQGFCALLDKFTAMRKAMKSLRKQYLHAKARLLTFEREAEIAATLPDDPGADLAEHKPPEMREDLDHRAQRMTLRPVVNTENKLDKLLAYEATFQSGYCWFDPSEGDQKLLLEQWYSVGGAKDHDDGPDAYDLADRQFPKILSAATGGGSRRTRGDMPFRETPERFEEADAKAFSSASGQAIWNTNLRSDQSFLRAGVR